MLILIRGKNFNHSLQRSYIAVAHHSRHDDKVRSFDPFCDVFLQSAWSVNYLNLRIRIIDSLMYSRALVIKVEETVRNASSSAIRVFPTPPFWLQIKIVFNENPSIRIICALSSYAHY